MTGRADATGTWNVTDGDAGEAANYSEQALPDATNANVTVANGGTMRITSDLDWCTLNVGQSGNGSVEQSGGHVLLRGASSGESTLRLGYASETPDIGYYNLSGGTLEFAANNNPHFGYAGIGAFKMTDGELIFRAGYPSIARLAAGYGHIDVAGGKLSAGTASQLSVGECGLGTLTVSGDGEAEVSKIVLGVNANSRGVVNLVDGGVLKAGQLYGGSGSLQQVNAVGGTFQASSKGGTQGYFNNTDVRLGNGGLTLDTAGHDVSLAAAIHSGILPVGKLAHRWSFNGDLTDSVGGKNAVLAGSNSGAVVYDDGQQIRLPGGSHDTAYISLGAGIIPTGCTEGVTIEMWFTPLTQSADWTRVFSCYGNNKASHGFAVIAHDVQLVTCNDGWGNVTGLGAFTIGQRVRMAIRFTPVDSGYKLEYLKSESATGWQLKKYQKTGIASTYDIADFASQCFNLGWSSGGDADAAIRFDEVRVWTVALSDTELQMSATLGPDVDMKSAVEFVKSGSGSLALASGNDYDGSTKVQAGTLVAADYEKPVSRWSFNGAYSDEFGGRTAQPTGSSKSNITLGEEIVTLPGATHGTAYLNLGSDIWDNFTDEFTFEFWLREDASKSWSRVFTFAGVSGAYTCEKQPTLFVTLGREEGNVNGDIISVTGGDEAGAMDHNKIAPWTLGQWFHLSIVGEKQTSGKWKLRFVKRDVDTGAILTEFDKEAPTGWDPVQFKSSPFNLGWSNGSDPDAAVSFDEVRVWQRAFTDDELTANVLRGPDLLPTPSVADQSGRLPVSTDLTVEKGATFALAGASQTVNSLVGAGTIKGDGTLTVTDAIRPGGADATGTLTLSGGVKLAGLCEIEKGDMLVFTGGATYDISSLEIKLPEVRSLAAGETLTIGRLEDGSNLSSEVTLTEAQRDQYRVRVKGGAILATRQGGFVLSIR